MQAQASDEGPSSGGPSASTISGRPVNKRSGIKERYDSKLLRAVAHKHDVDSTKSLVAAYNVTADEDERAVLLGWLRKYHDRSEDCLKPKSVLEYAELAKVKFRETEDDGILENVFRNLCSCICQERFLEPNFAASLYSALLHIDPAAYGGVAELVMLATKLLASLSPRPKLSRKNLARYETTFLALHQTFYLIHKTNQNDIDEKEKRELCQAISLKETVMELSCKHYPVDFHFKALRQAAEHLKVEDSTSRVAQIKQYLTCGLCGFLHVLHFLRNLARGDIDPVAVQDAYRRGRVVIDNMGVAKRPWFDWFRNLMKERVDLHKDEMNLGLFGSAFDALYCLYSVGYKDAVAAPFPARCKCRPVPSRTQKRPARGAFLSPQRPN